MSGANASLRNSPASPELGAGSRGSPAQCPLLVLLLLQPFLLFFQELFCSLSLSPRGDCCWVALGTLGIPSGVPPELLHAVVLDTRGHLSRATTVLLARSPPHHPISHVPVAGTPCPGGCTAPLAWLGVLEKGKDRLPSQNAHPEPPV